MPLYSGAPRPGAANDRLHLRPPHHCQKAGEVWYLPSHSILLENPSPAPDRAAVLGARTRCHPAKAQVSETSVKILTKRCALDALGGTGTRHAGTHLLHYSLLRVPQLREEALSGQGGLAAGPSAMRRFRCARKTAPVRTLFHMQSTACGCLDRRSILPLAEPMQQPASALLRAEAAHTWKQCCLHCHRRPHCNGRNCGRPHGCEAGRLGRLRGLCCRRAGLLRRGQSQHWLRMNLLQGGR